MIWNSKYIRCFDCAFICHQLFIVWRKLYKSHQEWLSSILEKNKNKYQTLLISIIQYSHFNKKVDRNTTVLTRLKGSNRHSRLNQSFLAVFFRIILSVWGPRLTEGPSKKEQLSWFHSITEQRRKRWNWTNCAVNRRGQTAMLLPSWMIKAFIRCLLFLEVPVHLF